MADDWKIILGTSNVKSFYDPRNFPEYLPYVVNKCTRIEAFRAAAAIVTPRNEYVVVSVFENILVDAVNASIGICQIAVPDSESDECRYPVGNRKVYC